MPCSASGRRRVRCPKCTAILTEPQSPIYECPICSTYLLAKGHGLSKTSDKSLLTDEGDAEEAQKITDGGTKPEKASLSNDDGEPLQGKIVNNLEFEREIDHQSHSHALSQPNSQTLAKHGHSNSGHIPSEFLSNTSPEKSGDLSPIHPSTHPSSDLGSDSCFESEADSPLWSPDAKAREALPVSLCVNGLEDSSVVPSSNELMSSSCMERQSQETMAGKDAKNGDKQQGLGQEERCIEEITVDKEGDSDKQQSLARHDHLTEESVDKNEAVGGYITTVDDSDSRTAGKVASGTARSSFLAKGTVKGEDLQINGDCKEKTVKGKFQLFDLSVFGIYNEETYNALQRDKVAGHPSLAENSVDGDNVEPPDGNELMSKLPSVAPQGLSPNKESSEAITDKVMLHSEKITSVSELPVPNTVAIDTGTGNNCETQVTASHENTGTGSLDSSAREAESVAVRSLGDKILRTVSGQDIDAIAKAQYGDDLGAIKPSSESTSVDISFGDWRSHPVPKFSNNELEVDLENAEHDKGMMNSAAEEDADSPWNDNEELSFSSIAKGGFKAEGICGSPVVTRDGNDEDQAKSNMDKSAFPLRTTAMQKLVKRDDQLAASQTQSSVRVIESESALYEAPHVARPLAPVPKENAPSKRELESRAEALELEHPENETDPRRQSIPDAHDLPFSTTNTPTSVYMEENRRQASHTDHPGSRKSFEVEASSQEDRMLWKTHNTSLETADLTSQNVDYFNQPKLNRREDPAALVSSKPKGKGSNIRSSSSTEDEGSYGMESRGVSILEEDPLRESYPELIGRRFPGREGVNGSRQQSSDLAGRDVQPAWIGTNEANHRRIGSGEPPTSRRTVRSRLANSKVSNQGPLMEEDWVHADEKSYDSEPSEWIGLGNLTGKKHFDSETPGWTGSGKLANQPNVNLGSGLNLNSRRPDQMSHHVSPGNISTDYSSDHLSRFQDIASHSQRNDYLRNHHGLMSNANAMAYAYQSPPYGSAALTAAHEEVLSHQSHVHHGISPACSICIQQQYFLQHPQMHQNMMLHQCAACAIQASVAHQPMHHEMHGHHLHDMMHLNHPIGHTDSIAWSADSIRQNSLRLQKNHLNLSARRMKRHPPLPGEGAPPYVLCRHCNQLLLAPKYLLAASGSVQRLHCGACGKISKFSIPHNHAPLSSRISSDRNDFVKMDKQHMDMARVYSSGQNLSNEFVSSAHKPLGTVRHTPGKGTDQVWIENRVVSPLNAHEISLIQPGLAGRPNRKKPPATTGSGQAAYGSRHTNGKHAFNDTGPFIEDYSSSPSSASGASPERLSQLSQDNQVAPALVTGRTNRDQNYRLDLASSQTLVHDQRTSYLRAPSFSDGVSQTGVMANQSRVSQTSLQGSTLKHFGDRPHLVHLEKQTKDSRSGSRHNDHADGNYFGLNSPRSHLEQGRKLAESPGSPVVERFTHGVVNDLPYAQQKQLQKSNGSRSAPRSPKSKYEVAFPQDPYSNTHSRGRSFEDDRSPRLPLHDSVKRPMYFAGLLKRSIKDRGKGGQGGGNRRKVIVNGYLISEAAVRKAEEQAGPIHSGTYWYDYQAGFWGVQGGPCMGILMPFIEEFNYPLARDCASGRTGILVNGRELHDEDLEVLAKRGLPTIPGKAYILDISGALFDDVSGRSLKGLGKLAPTIEKRGRGYGMSTSTPAGW